MVPGVGHIGSARARTRRLPRRRRHRRGQRDRARMFETSRSRPTSGTRSPASVPTPISTRRRSSRRSPTTRPSTCWPSLRGSTAEASTASPISSGHRNPGDARVLALVPSFAARLDSLRAMEWSARMRAAGMGRLCPLLAACGRRTRGCDRACSGRGARPRVVRRPPRPRAASSGRCRTLTDDELMDTLREVWAIAPMLADSVVVPAATTPRACADDRGHALLGRRDQRVVRGARARPLAGVGRRPHDREVISLLPLPVIARARVRSREPRRTRRRRHARSRRRRLRRPLLVLSTRFAGRVSPR